MHDWSKCFGRPVSGVEGVFALERAGWGDTHATNLVVVHLSYVVLVSAV